MQSRIGRMLNPHDLFRRQDLDMRLRCQDTLDQIRLQALQKRRHEHDHGHANRHADHDEQALHAAFAQEARSHNPLERL